MLNALTDLRRSQQLLHKTERVMKDAATRLAQARVLIARGEARALARTRAAVLYDETCHEDTVSHASVCPSL
jgi:hypothetical protein